jgi:ubiquinone/menaquinone biosynthesis C-methylase UbiE
MDSAPAGQEKNADQIAYWNGPGGQRWANRQQEQDILLVAEKIAPGGRVLGIDVSGPMLERARQIAPAGLPVDFVLADATIHPFDPAGFDLLVSRFGVMFFAEPVRSFTNLRKALKPRGRLALACWREPRENPFFMAPLQAVYKHAPRLPQVGPDDPGPSRLLPNSAWSGS